MDIHQPVSYRPGRIEKNDKGKKVIFLTLVKVKYPSLKMKLRYICLLFFTAHHEKSLIVLLAGEIAGIQAGGSPGTAESGPGGQHHQGGAEMGARNDAGYGPAHVPTSGTFNGRLRWHVRRWLSGRWRQRRLQGRHDHQRLGRGKFLGEKLILE